MRIAVLNAWPNLEYSAEREFISRLKRSCLNLGWTCIEVVTSEEVLCAQVDCLLVTHEFSPKLTEIPTIGLLWSPPVFFNDDSLRVRSVLSYDGYLAGSESVRDYLADLLFSTSKNSPVADWDFLPTAPWTEFTAPDLNDPALFYAGVHWDGNRHRKLIKGLCAVLPVVLYGDPSKLARFGSAYKGKIPFDGATIFDRIRNAGIALCLHRDEHLKHDLPSMRMFESAAGCAVIITENSKFAKCNFGDSVLYIDQEASDAEKIIQIRNHFEWVRSHTAEALELASKSHAIFNERYSLEKLLGRLPSFLEQVKKAGHFNGNIKRDNLPVVEVIVRIGGRSLFYVERCLDSLAAQSYSNIGLIVVSYREVFGLETLLEKYQKRFTSIRQRASAPTGFRSTALWDGMRAVDAEYFCNLDDDDTIHCNHIGSLVHLLESDNHYTVAYSGCVQVQDEPGHYYQQPNFNGPIGEKTKENRHLLFFEPFKRQRMLRFDNFVVSNSWLARRTALQERDFVDPKLVVSEDMYLYFLFMRRGDFLFSWKATSNWHWRSTSKDNSMMHETCQAECGERIWLRTQFFGLSEEALTCQEVVRPFVTYAWKTFPRVEALVRTLKKWL